MQRHIHLRPDSLPRAKESDSEAVFLWMAALAHADRKLCSEERSHLVRAARDLRIRSQRREELVRTSRQRSFEPPTPGDSTERSAWFRILARLTLRDGIFCHHEEAILRQFQARTQLGPGEYTDALESLHEENRSVRRKRVQMALAGIGVAVLIASLIVLFTRREERPKPTDAEWPVHISELDQGVFFIETKYEIQVPDQIKPLRRTGVGTAFLATDRGHLLTGKHVVKPWLYSAELADLMQHGGATVDETTVQISIWRTGSTADDPPFACSHKGDLRVLRFGKDDSVVQKIPRRGENVAVRVHRPSPEDYAVLTSGRLVGLKPLPLEPKACDLNAYHPVGVMGYPGGRILDPEKRLRPAIQAGHFTRPGSLLEVDLKAMGGVSGSPMFDRQTGRVLGIVASRASNDAFCRCVPISSLIDYLEGL